MIDEAAEAPDASPPLDQERRGDPDDGRPCSSRGSRSPWWRSSRPAVLMLDRVRPEKVYEAIDWPLLVMFAGLFVVVHAFEVNVVHDLGPRAVACTATNRRWCWSAGSSVLLSNLVSNVPAVLLFKPLMEVMPQKELAWLALAMSSTLAGNLTVLGSVANLIVVENARRAGTELGFLEYLKVGVPLTIVTTLVGVAWLHFVYY